LSQAKHEKLSTALVAAEATLVQKKAVLAGNIRTIYLQNQLSPIEVLASSGSISEFIDRQQYLSTLQESTGEIIGQITALKAQLESQRIEQEQLMAEQTVIRQGLQAQRTEVANLLAETEGQESAYQSRVASNSERVKQLKAQQAAYLEKLNGGGQYGGTGGYPAIWANACQDCLVDDWGMYNRECVSYSAWHRWANGKRMPYWGGRGNANQWPSNAMAAGILTNKTPAINSTAVFMGGPYGHVAQVIGIDGSMIKLAQYNADNTGRFSITTTHVNNIDWFIH
jgi:CRISPR/Cas system CMR-associated protein Cmr5 small subunit